MNLTSGQANFFCCVRGHSEKTYRKSVFSVGTASTIFHLVRGEELVEHIAHDRRDVCAVPRALADDADNDFRILERRERDKQTVIERFAVFVGFRRAGLAADLDGIVREHAAGRAALVRNLAHALHDQGGGFRPKARFFPWRSAFRS